MFSSKIGAFVGFVLATLTVAFLGFASYRSTQRLIRSHDAVAESHIVLAELEDLVTSVQEAERGERGYVITADKGFLELFESAGEQIEAELRDLLERKKGDAAFQKQHEEMTTLIGKLWEKYRRTIHARDTQGLEAAARIVQTGESKQLMDEIRSRVSDMENEERALLAGRTKEAIEIAQNTSLALSVGIFLSLSFLVLLFLGLHRQMNDRERVERAFHIKAGYVRLHQLVAVAANEATTIEQALQACLGYVCTHAGWPVGHAYFVSEKTGNLISSSCWHMDDPERFQNLKKATETTPLARGIGLPGRVLESGKPAWIVDVTQDPNFPRARKGLDLGVRGAFALPVFVGSEVAGILEFFCPTAEEPNQELLEALAPLGTALGRVVERKRAEWHLTRSRDYSWALFDELPAPIWRAGLDATCDYFNKSWYAFTGRTPEEEMGDGWAEGVHLDDRERVMKTYLDAFGAREPFVMEYRLRHSSGNYHWVVDARRPYQDLDGNFAGYIGCLFDITERRVAEEALLEVSGNVLRAQDEERRRIARELHDSTGQNLIGSLLSLSTVNRSASGLDPQARAALSESIEGLKKCLAEIRTISYLLHPPFLDELGLGPALRHYVEGFAQRSGLSVDVDIPSELPRAPREVEAALFRVAQQGLANVHRHSGSTTAEVRVTGENGSLTLEVKDRGVGIPPGALEKSEMAAARLGVGIPGMRERVRQLGGNLEIISAPGGTTVRATIPVQFEGT